MTSDVVMSTMPGRARLVREASPSKDDISAGPKGRAAAGDSDVGSMDADNMVERDSADYKCADDPFVIGERVYNKQFAHLYFQRLQVIRPAIQEKINSGWKDVPMKKILEVEAGVECAVIGTLYKDMKLKPSVLDEYSQDKTIKAALGASKFIGPDDSLIMEDEGARMKLCGDCLSVDELVSGIVVGVKGVEVPGGDFEVHDICFPGPAVQKPPTLLHEDKYVALVSGLHVGGNHDALPLQMLVDFLTGSLGCGSEQNLAKKVVRVVVAGNLVKEMSTADSGSDPTAMSTSLSVMKEVDLCLTQLAAALPVDVMPGPKDPANVSLPQQPFHRCLFPRTTQYANFERTTNPHKFSLDGLDFLGTSGQNIDDILKYVKQDDSRLDAMSSTLEWCHAVPTAPDTLPCFPFDDEEPFIIKESPHVYFVGNQPRFETGLFEGSDGQRTRVVALPSFASSGVAVLVNLRDLSCHPLTFSAQALQGN